ncbi:hypothetical protein [Schaalia cardiffensis]|nr:hypothetical protein [Schaalia cardiffensis]
MASASLCRRVLLMTRVKAAAVDPRRKTLRVLLMHEGERGSV